MIKYWRQTVPPIHSGPTPTTNAKQTSNNKLENINKEMFKIFC